MVPLLRYPALTRLLRRLELESGLICKIPLLSVNMSSSQTSSVDQDAVLLANLGYKQGELSSEVLSSCASSTQMLTELRRHFSPFEIFSIGFSIIGLVSSFSWVHQPISAAERLTVTRAGPFCCFQFLMEDLLLWSGGGRSVPFF
jgi:hypothetical protein